MIRIGTRGSRLALVQAEIVRERILGLFPEERIELVPVVTKGDREIGRPLASFGGKGVFTKEIERLLLDGQVDMAVHSAKDMPAKLPEGLSIGAVLAREDARDVFVSVRGIPAKALPAGSVVGTSSLRRKLQILNINNGLVIKDLRGNVPTRIGKLRDGQYDGILLAAAGLKRLGLDKEPDLKYEYFAPDRFLPAAGQGVLAVEICEGTLQKVMEALNDKRVAAQLQAEKQFLAELGGGCNAPCGVYCAWGQHQIRMAGMYAPDGVHSRYASMVVQENKGLAGGTGPVHQGIEAPEGLPVQVCMELAEKLADRLRKGQVALVGAGPGRRDCISREGLEWVQRAEVIVYDSLISPSILNEAGLDAELVYVGKRAGNHAMSQEKIQELLIREAEAGRNVVRLKGGDSFVFGRGGEELLALRAAGIPVRVIPGISSVYSVPASVGIPVTHREMASAVHIVTGHEGEKEQESIDYTVLAQESGTLVFLMGVSRIQEICARLIEGGKPKELPAAVLSRGMTARQRNVFGTLSDIAGKTEEEGITAPAIIVVGEVVSLAQEELFPAEGGCPEKWLPLAGKRILLTGTRRQAGRLEKPLEALGGEAVCLSLVETRELSEEDGNCWTERLSGYQWIVFTSAKGVEAFFAKLKAKRLDRRKLSGVRFAVVGAGTGEALSEQGYEADFVPSVYTSETLAAELCPKLAATDRVLLVRGRRGAAHLEKMLAGRRIEYDRAVLYETVADNRRGEELNRLYDDMDYVVITSGSGAEALAAMLSADRRKRGAEGQDREKRGEGKPDVEKLDMGKPDVGKPDMRKPDVEKLDMGKQDVEKLDMGKQDVEKLDIGKRNVGELGRRGVGTGRPKFVAIGPETARVCSVNGMAADIVAEVHDGDGILQAIVEDACGGKP